jgi:hypothetical protein
MGAEVMTEFHPIGPHTLYWACRFQGADAYRDGQLIDACPYGPDRQFSSRAWRDGWRAAARAAGVKLPHEIAAV